MINCVAFQMDDPNMAYSHIRENWEVIERYGSKKYDHRLYTWDDGYRILGRCKECNQLLLLQSSEFHGFSDNDSYYSDYFPVTSAEEADKLNMLYDGYEIEKSFKEKWLCITNKTASWK